MKPIARAVIWEGETYIVEVYGKPIGCSMSKEDAEAEAAKLNKKLEREEREAREEDARDGCVIDGLDNYGSLD